MARKFRDWYRKEFENDPLHEAKKTGKRKHDWYDQLAAFYASRGIFFPSRETVDFADSRLFWERGARAMGLRGDYPFLPDPEYDNQQESGNPQGQ